MLLSLRDIFISDGASHKLNYELDMSSINIYDSYPFVKPESVCAFVKNSAGLVKLTIDVCCEYQTHCDRCFKEISRAFNWRFNHNLVVHLSGDNDDEYIETPDYEIELDALVKEDILLELPSKFLCCDDCKGLCSICGKNLNDGICNCKCNRIDPRFEALKQLLD